MKGKNSQQEGRNSRNEQDSVLGCPWDKRRISAGHNHDRQGR